MVRMTITFSDERHQALKQAARRRNTTMRQIVEESIDAYCTKIACQSAALVAAARERSALSDEDALALAIEETWLERLR